MASCVGRIDAEWKDARRGPRIVPNSKDTLTPALAIELDDSSRQREGLLGGDRLVNHVLSRTGLPLLHVRADEAYDSKVLADVVDAAIKRGEAG
jgi:hypothetical protein